MSIRIREVGTAPPPRRRIWPWGKARKSRTWPVLFFISYENRDEGLITGGLEPLFRFEFQGHIAEPLYWKQSKIGGEHPWKQIRSWIRQSDGVLVLITQNAVTNPDNIIRECRYARCLLKPIFPFKDRNLQFEALGRFESWKRKLTFVDFDPDHPFEISDFTEILRRNYDRTNL